jgi:hypothetical protein
MKVVFTPYHSKLLLSSADEFLSNASSALKNAPKAISLSSVETSKTQNERANEIEMLLWFYTSLVTLTFSMFLNTTE